MRQSAVGEQGERRIRSVGSNALVYTAALFLQRGTAFLLLPLYTRYLSPSEYGILAIVTALNGFLVTLFSLSAHGAITRFYFEYRDDPAQLREFWGTVLTFVALTSLIACAVMLVAGERLLGVVLAGVPFWPYVAIGVATVVFQPFVTSFLNLFQARGEVLRYAGYSVANFVATAALTASLLLWAGWGVLAPLIATLAVSAAFTCFTLFRMRHEFRLCIRWRYLQQALAYCLPQVPHSLSSQVTAASDRMFLNHFLGRSTAGIYNVGAMLGMVVDMIGYGVNRAYAPFVMDVLSRKDPQGVAQLREKGILVVVCMALIGTFISLFAAELVAIIAAPDFQAAAGIVPFIAFSGAIGGAYYVLVSVLFYDTRAIRFLPLATLGSAAANVGLNLLLIPRFGIVGAGIANLGSQVLTTVVVAALARRFDPIRWPYWRFCIVYATCFAVAVFFFVSAREFEPASMLIRLAIFALLSLCLSSLVWGDFLYLLRLGRSLVRKGALLLRT